MKINVIRGDAGLWISPAPPYITNYLQYTKRGFVLKNFKKVDDFQKLLLYSLDGSGGIYTLQGFFKKIITLIEKNLDVCTIDDRRTVMPPIDWEAVQRVGLRDYQVDPIIKFLTAGEKESGTFKAIGAFGKTFVQAMTYAAWNSLNTILAIPYKEVTRKTFKDFKELFPDKHIGMMGGGMHDLSPDITITTFASLQNCALEKCQLLLVDELQGSTGDKIQQIFGQIKPYRIFGYTATDEGLFSKSEKVLKGIFGEPLVDIDYEEGLDMGAVVPGIVYMLRMPTSLPMSGDIDRKLKYGIRKNATRNELIGKICKAVPNKWQTLIFVNEIKNHLIPLMPYLPEGTKWVHRESNKAGIKEFALKPKEQDKIIDGFVNNEFQYLCATNALKAGFNSQNCRVVVQAAGGSSKIEMLQEAFRGNRILKDDVREQLGVEPKTHFVLVDIWDQQDETLENMSKKRKEIYESQGWPVKIIDRIDEIEWEKYGEN
jgi:superfamily II DNA or RNA helicase